MSRGSLVRWFRANNSFYEVVIFADEDNRIELINRAGDVMLTYDSSLNVLDSNKNKIGKIGIQTVAGQSIWVFNSDVEVDKVIYGLDTGLAESHLNLEVEVSKWYIQTYLKD